MDFLLENSHSYRLENQDPETQQMQLEQLLIVECEFFAHDELYYNCTEGAYTCVLANSMAVSSKCLYCTVPYAALSRSLSEIQIHNKNTGGIPVT